MNEAILVFSSFAEVIVEYFKNNAVAQIALVVSVMSYAFGSIVNYRSSNNNEA